MKTSKSYAYQYGCIPLRFPISKRNNENDETPFHKFLLLGERTKEWLIKIRRDERPQTFSALGNEVDCRK